MKIITKQIIKNNMSHFPRPSLPLSEKLIYISGSKTLKKIKKK